MNQDNVVEFLMLQAFALFSVAFSIAVYRMNLVPERAKRSQRIFLIMMTPPFFVVIQIIALSLLFAPGSG